MPLRAPMSGDDEPTLRIVPASSASSPTPSDTQRAHRFAPPAGRHLQPDEVIAGRYRLLEPVGRGGMGVVWKAWDQQLGLCVALKVLRPELANDARLNERFRRELVAARQVSHRNAVRIHDIGQDGDLLFLTMDFVDGPSLQALLRRERRLAPERAADIARQLALALEAAHEAGIVHRDLKPGNVLIETSGRACVTDFGLARSSGDSGHDLTRTGMIAGTPAYLSPEQACGASLDGRSDLYALGILLFEMLTGELPFAGHTAAAVQKQRLSGMIRDLRALCPDVPPRLAEVALRLLERDAARRFQNAREVVEALEDRRLLASPVPRSRWAALLILLMIVPVLALLLTSGSRFFWKAPPQMQPPLPTPEERSTRMAQAQEARLRGKPEKARQILAELVERSSQDLEARIELAETYGEEGNLTAAIDHLRQVTEADPDHPRAWLLLAKHAILAGDSQNAADEYLVRALVIQDRLGSQAGQAEVYNALGVAYNDLGELDQAAESYRRAAEIRRRIGDQRGLAVSLRNLAAVDSVQGEQERAGKLLTEALEIVQRLGDAAGLADVSNDLGLLAEERGRYQEAMEHYRRGLQLRRRLGQTLSLAESLNNVGYVSYILGRLDDATVYWNQALALYRQGGDQSGIVIGTQGIGLLQMAHGDWDAALRSFEEALDASRKLGIQESTAAALLHRGRVELLQGRMRAAFASFAEAVPLLRELGDVRGQTELILAEAEAWLEVGDLETARKHLDAAELLLAGGRNGEQGAELLRLRGDWHRQRGETAPARQALQQAVAEAEASHSAFPLLQARIAQARLEGSRKLDELRALQAEAEALGHRGLELQAAEALAEAALAGGRLADAEAAARRGLEAVQDCGTWSGAFRLHLLLAQTLERRGLGGEAAGQRERATAELARLRRDLAPLQPGPLEAIAAVH
jgi:serine/threonine protein kinase/Tfp pilus assembly protein PilF